MPLNLRVPQQHTTNNRMYRYINDLYLVNTHVLCARLLGTYTSVWPTKWGKGRGERLWTVGTDRGHASRDRYAVIIGSERLYACWARDTINPGWMDGWMENSWVPYRCCEQWRSRWSGFVGMSGSDCSFLSCCSFCYRLSWDQRTCLDFRFAVPQHLKGYLPALLCKEDMNLWITVTRITKK